ncbi:response regulator [Anaerolineales bacterium HSG24]|nr:response regulator [Anaerolineales bacterium HSG24]
MKYTILIIEDDPDTATMLQVYFGAQGYNVIAAPTGKIGIAKARNEKPNLILLDVRLPDMDGFEIGQHLQSDIRTSRLPVIFVTERRGRDDRISGLKLGAVDYVTKPFDVQELRLRVRNTLRRVGSQNNPVTGLPGEKVISDRISLLLEDADWATLSITVQGLDKFNEIYGFVARDDVLRAITLTLTSAVDELGSIDDFIGHPVENRFIILTIPNKINKLKQNIEHRLRQAMTYFYPIHDREAGYVQLGDDDSEREEVPFMYIITVAISVGDIAIADAEELLQYLNRRKKL